LKSSLCAATVTSIRPLRSSNKKRADALLVSPQALLLNRRTQILTLAARHAVPAIYPAREWTTAGGLMSYGSSLADQYTQAGIYTGRILKGEKTLPILRATKFDFRRQPADRQRAPHRNSPDATRARRRGDRVRRREFICLFGAMAAGMVDCSICAGVGDDAGDQRYHREACRKSKVARVKPVDQVLPNVRLSDESELT